jgi:tol-pal system protein YbgF
MRRYSVLAVVGLLLAAGCATNSDMRRVEDRIRTLYDRNQALEKRIERQLDKLSQVVEQRKKQENRLRELFAGQNAEFYELRDELRHLTGRFEESEHRLSRKLADLKTAVETNRQELTVISESVTVNDTRISRLADYLGIEASEEKLDAAVQADEAAEASGEGQAASDLPEDKLYRFAKKSFDQENFETARDAFEKFLEMYPDSDKADNARFWIGEVYFNEEWYEKAILEYQKVIDNYPQGNKVAAAYLKQGIAFQELGETGNAKLVLKELVRKFPESNEANIARQTINRLD